MSTDLEPQKQVSPLLTTAQATERANDGEWNDYTLTTVKDLETGYECGSDGTCWFIGHERGIAPVVGHTMRLYGAFGSVIRGMDYDGQPVYYRTEAERDADHKEWVDALQARYRAAYEADKDRLTAELLTLPEAFQARIMRRLSENPDYAWEGMGQRYEQFALVQAVKIHDHFDGDAERILAWRVMDDYTAQKAHGPKLDEGMSGNQFGFAGYMAEALARGVA